MGILDQIISGSPFLSGTQQFFQPPQAQQPVQPMQPLIAAPQPKPKGQGGGMDMGTIMKIASMFGGM